MAAARKAADKYLAIEAIPADAPKLRDNRRPVKRCDDQLGGLVALEVTQPAVLASALHDVSGNIGREVRSVSLLQVGSQAFAARSIPYEVEGNHQECIFECCFATLWNPDPSVRVRTLHPPPSIFLALCV